VYVTGSCDKKPGEEDQADEIPSDGVAATTSTGDHDDDDDDDDEEESEGYIPSPERTPVKKGVYGQAHSCMQ